MTEYRYTTYEDETYERSWVYVPPSWQTSGYDLTDEWDLANLAEACADDYHSNHDGWEHRSWNDGSGSVTFYIWTSETTKVRYDVWLEYQPHFSAVARV